MKQPLRLKHWMAISLALVFIGSCTDDDFGPERWKRQKTTDTGRFTVDEAKQAFERHYTVVCHSRSETDHGADDVTDDDFTPLWDVAVCRDRDSSSFMTVPISTHKLIRIADIRNGKENPQRLAIVKEELHIVKNHAMNMVVPTMKTIIPLDGSDLTAKGSSPKKALYIYRLLNGEVLNYQLFRDGHEVFHTYPGEDPASYHAKMEEIDRELEGLSLIEGQFYTFSGANENDITFCGYCGRSHPITTICDVVVTNCAKCGARIPSSGYHNCPNERSTCAICYASYITSQGHTCPKPNYCNICGQSFTNSHTCPGPTPKHCNLCNQSYVGTHNCPGLAQVCSKCKKSYIGSHNCQGDPTKICNSCGQRYVGAAHINCPNFCAICGTTPCKSKCSTCGKKHCSDNHCTCGNCEKCGYPTIGNGTDPLGEKYSPTSTYVDRLAKSDIPDTMGENQSQIESTCVFSCMSYLSTIFGDTETQGFYYLEYLKKYTIPLTGFNGVASDDFGTFVNEFFYTSPSNKSLNEIYGAISNGNVIIASALENGTGHAIVLVGFRNDGNLIFMDPYSGCLQISSANSPILINDYYIVTQKK